MADNYTPRMRKLYDATIVAAGGQDRGSDGRDAWIVRLSP